MFQRIFSRPNISHYIVISVFVMLFVVYEVKLWYAKYQKGKRFTYYNTYVNDIHKVADNIESSLNKSNVETQKLSRLLQIVDKKNWKG